RPAGGPGPPPPRCRAGPRAARGALPLPGRPRPGTGAARPPGARAPRRAGRRGATRPRTPSPRPARRTPLQLGPQPGAGAQPVALDRAQREPHHLGRLLLAEAGEVAALEHLGQPRIVL